MFKKLLKKKDNNEKYDDNKKKALEKALGPVEFVLHSPVPFHLGYDMGGKSDVFVFKKHINGVVYVTNDLIESDQIESNIGRYELMVCHLNEDDNWGANIISNLAFYTLDEKINSGDTMSIGDSAGKNSKIKAFLFDKYACLNFDITAALMLCIGITEDELVYACNNGSDKLVNLLKDKKIYPYTILDRRSVLE